MTVIKQYDKVKLKSGKYAIIVEVLSPQKAYIADVEIDEGEYETDTIFYGDIASVFEEIEHPLLRTA
jgi:hypothetical protein